MEHRWVDFAGVLNFRDVGGLSTADGATVRMGSLFRTDALCGLLPADRAGYAALGMHTVIDLRREGEIEAAGRAPEWACVSWHNIPLREGAWPVGECADADAVVIYLSDVYLAMTVHGAEDLVNVLTLIADPATGPAVVHCAGGRDRTGVVIALLLDLIGVPDEQIAADYTMTERFTQRWLDRQFELTGERPELPANLLHTPPATILRFLTLLRDRHGSVLGYLLSAGMSPDVPARLRERLCG